MPKTCYLSIGQFAEEIDMKVTTLRDWSNKGWLPPHHTSLGGKRYYSIEQVVNYKMGLYKKGVKQTKEPK